MGEPQAADPATIMQVEYGGDPAWGVNRGDAMTVRCNYRYLTDNLLDPSHVYWVQQGASRTAAMIGDPLKTRVNDDCRTAERSGGKEGVSTEKTRGARVTTKKNKNGR